MPKKPGRTPQIEAHPHQIAITAALLAGQSSREIAAQFAVSPDAVDRWRKKVRASKDKLRDAVPETDFDQQVQAIQTAEIIRDTEKRQDFIAPLKQIANELYTISQDSRQNGDLDTATKALRETRATVIETARMAGHLQETEATGINLAVVVVNRESRVTEDDELVIDIRPQ